MANEIERDNAALPISLANAIDDCDYLNGTASEDIAAGAPVRYVASGADGGKIANANATNLAEARVIGLARDTVVAGQTTVVFRRGVVEGFDLSDLDYGATVWLSDTDGRLSTVPGTQRRKLGMVIPRLSGKIGVAPDRLLKLDVPLPDDAVVDADFANTINSGDNDTDDAIEKIIALLVANGLAAGA